MEIWLNLTGVNDCCRTMEITAVSPDAAAQRAVGNSRPAAASNRDVVEQLHAKNARLQQQAAQRSAELQVKARELQIKERELGIKAYEAETSRMQATQPSVFRSPYGEGA